MFPPRDSGWILNKSFVMPVGSKFGYPSLSDVFTAGFLFQEMAGGEDEREDHDVLNLDHSHSEFGYSH